MDKITKGLIEDSVCFVCKRRANGYIVIDGRDEKRKIGRKLTLFMCSNHMRKWCNGELDYIIVEKLREENA